MTTAQIQLELLSAATFGRGDGVAGLVDAEIVQDGDGFPYLRGRTLKGLLAEAAEDAVFALQQQGDDGWQETKEDLFGVPGSGLDTEGMLSVGPAQLPAALRQLLVQELDKLNDKKQQAQFRADIFAALTAERRQTAVAPDGAPADGTLRTMRVLVRGVVLVADLSLTGAVENKHWALLTTAVLGVRAAGTGRNRGRGWVRATLNSEAFMAQHLQHLGGKQ